MIAGLIDREGNTVYRSNNRSEPTPSTASSCEVQARTMAVSRSHQAASTMGGSSSGNNNQALVKCAAATILISMILMSAAPALVTAHSGSESSSNGNPNIHNGGSCEDGFYKHSCPNVETIVFESMRASFLKDRSVAPGVLRLAYHDCFVRGCDASVLLDGTATEKTAVNNAGLHGFEAVDAAKEAVERACPGVVSCADVLQFAVRDSVILTGGQGWAVPAGRRDGKVSLASEVPENLLTPNNTVPALLQAFARKGLNAAQMVTLAGAHSIGQAACVSIDDRIHGSHVDPSLQVHFAQDLKKKCPMAGLSDVEVNLDLVSPTKFDAQFFKNIVNKRGLLTSDQSMWADARTQGLVQANTDSATFNANFAAAMVALSQVDVLTGTAGEIRRQCRYVN